MTRTRCAVAGCGRPISIPTRQFPRGAFDPPEGICPGCSRRVAPDRLRLFLDARRAMAATCDLETVVLAMRAWELVKMSAAERLALRVAA